MLSAPTLSTSAQQINYDGETASTLQNQVTGQDVQNSSETSGQVTESVISNAGSETLNSIPADQSLTVTGGEVTEPAKDQREIVGWFIIGGTLLLLLLSPALLYVRSLRKQADTNPASDQPETTTEPATQSDTTVAEPETAAATSCSTEPVKQIKPKKKKPSRPKKKSGKKRKR